MKIYMYLVLLSMTIFLTASMKAQMLVDDFSIATVDIATNLVTPWEILWGPDDHIWITERYGRVSRIDPASGEVKPLITIGAVVESGEAGLLGMALHPEFPDVAYVYLVYTYIEGQGKERIVRYTYNGEALINEEVLLENIPASDNHNGSRIAVGPDNKLYVSLGDATNTSTSQNPGLLNGKILRMNLDGTVPSDNPIKDSYVWSIGHRNPQGLVFSSDGKLYSSEHGPQNDDELNLISENGNYGWPSVHGFCDGVSEQTFCQDNNVIEPLAAWTPTLAVAGLDYYSNSAINIWKDALLLVSLKAGKMLSLHLSANGEQISDENIWINGEFGRLRDICISPSGRVFISTSNRDGRGSPEALDDRIIELLPDIQNSLTAENSDSGIELFPNPATELISIAVSDRWTNARVAIYDGLGHLVFHDQLISDKLTIGLNEFSPGIYRAHVLAEKWNYQTAFIVIR